MLTEEAERLFGGVIGEEYDMLKQVCPAAAEMSRQVGEFVEGWQPGRFLRIFEIGCGTGITTAALLSGREDSVITALDNEPGMLTQAKRNLAPWIEAGRLQLQECDALSGLQSLPDASVDVVASAYTLHNFLNGYRRQVIGDICRVLKPGGVFVNGDRYALDDTLAHTRLAQEELRHYCRTFYAMARPDLLEQWVVHMFSDESPDHIMRLESAIAGLKQGGFDPVLIHYREGVNTLLSAVKPASSEA